MLPPGGHHAKPRPAAVREISKDRSGPLRRGLLARCAVLDRGARVRPGIESDLEGARHGREMSVPWLR